MFFPQKLKIKSTMRHNMNTCYDRGFIYIINEDITNNLLSFKANTIPHIAFENFRLHSIIFPLIVFH